MKKFFWAGLILLALIASLQPTLAGSTNSAFTNKWDIFKAPIKVSENYAILDYGLEAVYEFAYGERSSQSWVYAYESSLDFDSKTGKFSLKKEAGEDRFIRFFGKDQAEIIIDWAPIKENDDTLEERFNDLQKQYADVNREMNCKLQKVGGTIKDKIGGYPALGIKLKMNEGKVGYTTFWVIRSERINRWFYIRFFYAKDFQDPSGSFSALKKGIVFLQP